MEIYDQDDNFIGHIGNNMPNCDALSKKVFLYLEGKSIAFIWNGQEMSLCDLDFHFLFDN